MEFIQEIIFKNIRVCGLYKWKIFAMYAKN